MSKPTAEVRRRWRKKAIKRMVVELPHAVYNRIDDGMKQMGLSRQKFVEWAYDEALRQGLIEEYNENGGEKDD